MQKTKLFEFFQDAYEVTKREDDSGYTRIKESASEEQRELMIGIQHDSDLNFEISYEIANSASMIFSDLELEDLADADFCEASHDTASVYTNTRLSWLSNSNEDEVTAILKEYDCDIQTACAVWYEQQVARMCEAMREAINDLSD